MAFQWSARSYTAPFLRDLIYNHRSHDSEEEAAHHRGEAVGQYKLMRHNRFAKRVSELPLSDERTGHLGSTGGCSSTLNVQSLVPSTTFGDQCATQIRGSDIFFLPKPSQLLMFALPVFVLMPNLTVFTRQFFFYGPK